ARALASPLGLAAATFAASARQSQQPPMTPSFASTYSHAAVAADHPLASQAGAEILKAGGNAVDAAVATSFALSVVRPYSCGIGGGGFMVIRLPNHPRLGKVETTINYREWGVAAARPDMFETDPDPDAATHGGKAVCVPGTVAGLLHALEMYGTMTREQVLVPAIRLAREGFAVDQHYEDSARKDTLVLPWLEQAPERQARFAFLWERFLDRGRIRKGYVLKLPEQAAALELIATEGAKAFYEGPIAKAIVEAVRKDGGSMTLDDLASYRVEERPPLRTTFRGSSIMTMPPPSSGGVVLAQVLEMLESRSDLLKGATDATTGGPGSAAYIHLLTEASKHAFADRARWMGDPNFTKLPLKAMLSSEYVASRGKLIDMTKTLPTESYGTATPLPADAGTSHLSVVDAQGGAVACTETINLIFGSLLPVPEFGFILNDEMDDFATRGGKANAFGLDHADLNRPQPRKRPLSSMTPTIVTRDGKVALVVGGAGGPRIISGTMQVTLNALLFGMNAHDAVERPRFHHQWHPDVLQLEPSLRGTPGLVDALKSRGHEVGDRESVASVQLIRASPEGWQAASDPRKGGAPAGH
ncbi:MAG: gamma-glutamyltransferase, partial [Phycisphaerae bacterium]